MRLKSIYTLFADNTPQKLLLTAPLPPPRSGRAAVRCAASPGLPDVAKFRQFGDFGPLLAIGFS